MEVCYSADMGVSYCAHAYLFWLKSELSRYPAVLSQYLGDVPKENLSDLQTRPGYVSGLSPKSSVISRHSGDVVPKENLSDT